MKHELIRFDMMLPRAAVRAIEAEAEIRGIAPRTLGRILIIEKTKEMIGIEQSDVLVAGSAREGV